MTDAPQYTYGATKPEVLPPQPPRSEFEVRLTARCNEWRDKHPERATALRRIVGRMLGVPMRTALSDGAVAAICAPTEEQVIAAMLGWPATEREWGDR